MGRNDNYEREATWIWCTTIVVILTLLMCILSSCRTKKETTVDFQVESSTGFEQRTEEETKETLSAWQSEVRDTVSEKSVSSGRIEIVRDTAGRAVTIIYENIFNGLRTQGRETHDTVATKEVVVVRDSTADSRTQLTANGKTKEKKDSGVNLISFGWFWIPLLVLVLVLYFLIRKRVNSFTGK